MPIAESPSNLRKERRDGRRDSRTEEEMNMQDLSPSPSNRDGGEKRFWWLEKAGPKTDSGRSTEALSESGDDQSATDHNVASDADLEDFSDTIEKVSEEDGAKADAKNVSTDAKSMKKAAATSLAQSFLDSKRIGQSPKTMSCSMHIRSGNPLARNSAFAKRSERTGSLRVSSSPSGK